jgi:hypothetical protein
MWQQRQNLSAVPMPQLRIPDHYFFRHFVSFLRRTASADFYRLTHNPSFQGTLRDKAAHRP